MSSFSHNARVVLIRIGKILPFLFCFLVCISYTETLYALITHNYLAYNDYITFDKPVSFFIGGIVEYDIMSVIVTLIISIAIETCIWNRLAVVYLALHLIFKMCIEDVELSEELVVGICLANILMTVFLCYKGLRALC